MRNDAGLLVQRARRRAGLTQAELARRVATTQSAIARLERGDVDPGFQRVVQLIEACGYQLDTSLGIANTDSCEAGAELATLRRNLSLSYEQRLLNVVGVQSFIDAGRAAMAVSAPHRRAKTLKDSQ